MRHAREAAYSRTETENKLENCLWKRLFQWQITISDDNYKIADGTNGE